MHKGRLAIQCLMVSFVIFEIYLFKNESFQVIHSISFGLLLRIRSVFSVTQAVIEAGTVANIRSYIKVNP